MKPPLADVIKQFFTFRDGDVENAGLENSAPGKVWNTASALTLLYEHI